MTPESASQKSEPAPCATPGAYGRRERWLLFGLLTSLLALDSAMLETVALREVWPTLGPVAALLFGLTQSALWGLALFPLLIILPVSGWLLLDHPRKAFPLRDIAQRLWSLEPQQASHATGTLLAALLSLGFGGGLMFAVSTHALETYPNPELIPWLVGGVSIGAMLAALLLFRLLQAFFVRLLLRIAGAVPALGILLSPRALSLAGLGLLLVVTRIVLDLRWPILQSLPLKEALVGLLVFSLALAAWLFSESPLAAPLLVRLKRNDRLTRRVLVICWLALHIASLVIMDRSMVVRDLVINDGLVGGEIARVIQQTVDFDGDGYSMLYGGGDCNDFDPRVHPNALEIPDDGIDNNCIAGDFTAADFERPTPLMHPLPEGASPAKNVVMVVMDAVRAESTSLNGYEKNTTPALKAIADASCVTFTRAYATGPKTNLSIGALFFGKRAGRIRWTTGSGPVPDVAPDETSLAEILRRRGFDTTAFSIIQYHADYMRGFFKGFDYRDYYTWATPEYRKDPQIPTSGLYTDEALGYLKNRKHKGRPYFLYLHYFDPHAYYRPPPEFARFGSDTLGRYLGEILYTDHHVGRLHGSMRTAGKLKDTVFIVTSDHGEGLGKHGAWTHGQNLFEEQIHVPLMICAPGFAPRQMDDPVSLVDIPPTLANLMNFPPRRDWEGRSLLPAMLGEALEPVPLVAEIIPDNKNRRRVTALILGDSKLIYNHISHSYSLYDLGLDPTEAYNRFSSDHASRRTLLPLLHRVIDEASALRGMQKASFIAEDPPEDMIPLDVRFEDGITLLGYTISTTRPARGERVDVQLVWKADSRPTRSYRIFVHVEAALKVKGKLRIFKVDHAPADNLYPTSAWAPGEIVLDNFAFELPDDWPKGKTNIWVGMWDKGRLPFVAPAPLKHDSRNRLLLQELRP